MSGASPEQERHRRLAEVFGEVLPEQSGDETDDTDAARAADDPGGRGTDAWLHEQVPPHHS
ncbi:MAG: hypothetical protein M3130_02050 [Actinomycetota bacterium]|nr:hypothetical protein [Actinomycetota bacterium]